jgi:hypothetical protein
MLATCRSKPGSRDRRVSASTLPKSPSPSFPQSIKATITIINPSGLYYGAADTVLVEFAKGWL